LVKTSGDNSHALPFTSSLTSPMQRM